MSNRFSLDGKTAIVTGANGLLGSAICEAYLEFGANLVMIDQKEYSSFNISDNSIYIKCDITSKDDLIEAKNQIIDKFGKIDVLVNNAAINDMLENPINALEDSKFENYPFDLFMNVMKVNIGGVFLCSQVFGNEMAIQKSGSIINIASTYGITAPNQSLYINERGEQTFYKSAAYPASKGAVIMLTKFLASYWGHLGIRTNTISPGGIENKQPEHFIKKYSEMTPSKRMAQTEDFKGAIVYLSSDLSKYVNGANLSVDGGWTAW